MYEDHYHVLDDPFRFTPDEHKPYQHHSYLSGVAFLQHVLDHSRKVMILIYGASGVGKSTLVNDILRRQDPNRVLPVKLKASTVNNHGVIESVSSTFELLEGGTEAEQLNALNDFLMQKSAENLFSLFVIEDAHELSAESLNKLGQLVRLIWDNRYKMKIFLIGSPILDQLLYQSKSDVLQKKILIGWNQHGMGDSEISGYVAHRIQSVGGTKLKFEDIVWRTLYDFSDGIPRRINRICNKLLLNGFIDKKLAFVNADILDAIRQLDNEGLLEVKKSFATLHGLKGTSNSHLDEASDMEVGQFAAGFTTPSLIEKFLLANEDIGDDGDDEDAPARHDPMVNKKIPVVNERFNPASEVKIPEDLRHQATFDTDESSWFNERKTAIFATLGLVTILGLMTLLFVDKDSNPQTAVPVIAMQDKEKTDMQIPSDINKERDEENLVAADVPEVPEPAVAKEESSIQVSETPVTPPAASEEVKAAVIVAEEDIDESGQVEELARLAREKALAEKMAEEEEAARKALEEAAAAEEVKIVKEPRYTTQQMKNMLLSGIWYRSGQQPAVLFPSQLNTCTESRLDVFCRATETITQVDNKKITSRTGAMFHHFTGEGEFNVSYRRSAGIESGQITSGNDLTEYQMSCRFIGETVVDCYKDGNRIKFLRR